MNFSKSNIYVLILTFFIVFAFELLVLVVQSESDLRSNNNNNNKYEETIKSNNNIKRISRNSSKSKRDIYLNADMNKHNDSMLAAVIFGMAAKKYRLFLKENKQQQ